MRVHESQAYRKMDVTSERISHILKLREILLSFQTGFNLVNAVIVCANLETIFQGPGRQERERERKKKKKRRRKKKVCV